MKPRDALKRQSNSGAPLPICSTVRISIKESRLKDSSGRRNDPQYRDQTLEEYEYRMDCILSNNIRIAFREFLAFFYRHRIQICFAGLITEVPKTRAPRIERPIFNSFIKNY